jgi:hypothetical protein
MVRVYKTAVVLPLYKPFSSLDIIEKISLRQLYNVMHPYDIYFVTHSDIDIEAYKMTHGKQGRIRRVNFHKSYFENIEGYNRLLLSFHFYNTFKAYKYILVTQLDVFIFSDQLSHFTRLGYDYIGAPWFEGYGLATIESKIIGVGNGGFSLRKVSSFLSVLGLASIFQKRYVSIAGLSAILFSPLSFLSILKYRLNKNLNPNVPVFPWQFQQNEDLFWGLYVKQFFPWFKVGSVKDAISFSFELNPTILYKLNDNQLPMGVHAWHKYDINFWKPFIEREGFVLQLSTIIK